MEVLGNHVLCKAVIKPSKLILPKHLEEEARTFEVVEAGAKTHLKSGDKIVVGRGEGIDINIEGVDHKVYLDHQVYAVL